MKENSTSVITLLIAGISVIWLAVIALVVYIRHLHIKAEKKAEEHAIKLMDVSEKHRKDIVAHKDEILEITKKFTEVVIHVNTSITVLDKTIEAGQKMVENTLERMMKGYDDLHRAVMQITK